MSIHLVVVAAFATYVKGDLITDSAIIAQVNASEDRKCVVRVIAAPQQGG